MAPGSAKTRGTVRRAQIITTYGVGAIVAVEDESFMVAGIDRWPVDGPNLHEPRLERELNVRGFVVPPASEDGPDLPVVRFPTWGWCPSCHTLNEHRFFTSFDKNKCNACEVALVPSRFVIACPRGHIDDFPYFRWLHAGSPPAGKSHSMRIEAGGTTASLRDIVISCECGKVVSMEGAFAKNALRGISDCGGRRPWLIGMKEDCPEVPRTLQRGASNVWFPIVRSALSIPPWSEGAFKLLNKHWTALRHIPDEALGVTITGMGMTEGTPYSVEDLVLAVKQRKERENDDGTQIEAPLKAQEYEALIRGKEEASPRQDFVCVAAGRVGEAIADWFDQVMLVKRLREVRVLEAFTRLLPPGPADPLERRVSIFDTHPGWLPAVEVIGEGVFLRLDREKLERWEARPEVRDRADRINKNYLRTFQDVGAVPDRSVSPRLILVHTLAHALINQWALDSGYPAASLRERLYVSDVMSGFLIYTATTDSAGSLGGVVGQASADRLPGALIEGLSRVSWCSADPVCIEAEAQGVDSLNLAACHACVLLPEVSCEEMNLLLDRGLLIGVPNQPQVGFFADLIE